MNNTTAVSTFQFNIQGHHDEILTHNIRVVTIEDQPWFVASDVMSALGLTLEYGPSHHLRGMDAEERMVLQRKDATLEMWCLFIKQAARIVLLSESGLYKLIMRSDKPQAKPFQDWVTKVVLPSIRKTGAYVVGQEKQVSRQLPLEMDQKMPPADASPMSLMVSQMRAFTENFCRVMEASEATTEQASREPRR